VLLGRLRSRGRNLLALLGRYGSRDRGDLRFLCSRWFITGRVVFRFRRRVIDIIDISSPVGLGGGLVDGSPLAIDDEFVQDLLLPGNVDGGNEAFQTLLHMNGTSPPIKGSSNDDLVGVVRPLENQLV